MPESSRGYVLKEDTIIIERGLTELDLFAKKFVEVLKKHSDYLIVSGFVSVCSGRARGTEDIDIIVPIMSEMGFEELFNELTKNDFWCYQGDDPKTAYRYVKDLRSIRFALKGEIFPNIEFIPFNNANKAKWFEFNHPQKIKIRDFEFKIPQIEFEILYKELVLKGKKDIEDAKHLRTFFSDIIREAKFREYAPIVESELE